MLLKIPYCCWQGPSIPQATTQSSPLFCSPEHCRPVHCAWRWPTPFVLAGRLRQPAGNPTGQSAVRCTEDSAQPCPALYAWPTPFVLAGRLPSSGCPHGWASLTSSPAWYIYILPTRPGVFPESRIPESLPWFRVSELDLVSVNIISGDLLRIIVWHLIWQRAVDKLVHHADQPCRTASRARPSLLCHPNLHRSRRVQAGRRIHQTPVIIEQL